MFRHREINGRVQKLLIPAFRTLLEVLRDDLGLTGTNAGARSGVRRVTVLARRRAGELVPVLAPQIDEREC